LLLAIATQQVLENVEEKEEEEEEEECHDISDSCRVWLCR
jgi:hypothetical protein